ncbi:13838_t:CDS:2, partial [Dentiscutata erythropus]
PTSGFQNLQSSNKLSPPDGSYHRVVGTNRQSQEASMYTLRHLVRTVPSIPKVNFLQTNLKGDTGKALDFVIPRTFPISRQMDYFKCTKSSVPEQHNS